jgi:flagellin-like protein
MEKWNGTGMKCGDRDSAVSEVIGTILLVAIVMTAVAITSVALLSQPAPEKVPSLDAGISKDTANKMIHLFHAGGDTLNRENMYVLVDGSDYTASFNKSSVPGWTTWATGEWLDYNYTGRAEPQKVQIIYTSPQSTKVLAVAQF